MSSAPTESTVFLDVRAEALELSAHALDASAGAVRRGARGLVVGIVLAVITVSTFLHVRPSELSPIVFGGQLLFVLVAWAALFALGFGWLARVTQADALCIDARGCVLTQRIGPWSRTKRFDVNRLHAKYHPSERVGFGNGRHDDVAYLVLDDGRCRAELAYGRGADELRAIAIELETWLAAHRA
jgi:hypothetical protein